MHVLPFSDNSLAEAIEILRKGGVVAHATETCYGLACDMSNPAAVKKVFAIKQRPEAQPVSALFASVDDAKAYVEWNTEADKLATHLPGPLTIILPLKSDAKLLPTPEGGATIGVRVSSHPHAQALVEAFGKPLSTTSANVHGKENPYDVQTMLDQFGNDDAQPDLILDSGTLPQNPPSTIVNLADENSKTLRKGSLNI